jgi:hypothetical protein
MLEPTSWRGARGALSNLLEGLVHGCLGVRDQADCVLPHQTTRRRLLGVR